jgi:hypothetical protein
MHLNLDSLRLRLEHIREEHPRTSSSATVYFLKCEQYVKIGTTRGPVNRFSAIQTDNPFDIKCLYSFNCIDAYGCESKIQSLFPQHRQEWFHITHEQLDVIRSVFGTNINADLATIAEDDKEFKMHQYRRALSHLFNTFPLFNDDSITAPMIKLVEEKFDVRDRPTTVDLITDVSSKKRKRMGQEAKEGHEKRPKVYDHKAATRFRASLLSLTPEEVADLDFYAVRSAFKRNKLATAQSVAEVIGGLKVVLAVLGIPFEKFLAPDGMTEVSLLRIEAAESTIQECWTTIDRILQRPLGNLDTMPIKPGTILRRIFRYFSRKLKAGEAHRKVDKWFIHLDADLD